MIQHQFGYSSIILEKMYLGELVDSKMCVLNLNNTLSFYDAESIEDIESLLYEYFKVKDFDFNELLSNKAINAKNIISHSNRGTEGQCLYSDMGEVSSRENDGEVGLDGGNIYTPMALPYPLPSILLDKGTLSGTPLERSIKNLLLLEKKHIIKCIIRNIEIEKNDADTMFMVGPFMMALLDYIQFSTDLINELQRIVKEEKLDGEFVRWEFGDYVKEERCIPIKETLSVFSYFRCILFELYQEILLICGDVINKDGRRKSFYELYSMCFEHYPSKDEEDSYTKACLLYQAEKLITLYEKEAIMSLLARFYTFYDKHRGDEQIRRAILRLENKVYWVHVQCFIDLAALEDWDYINKHITKIKDELIEKIACEVNPRKVILILDGLNQQLQEMGFLHLPASKLVDIEFSIVRILDHWLKAQYDLYNNCVSQYLPIIDSNRCNMNTEVKSGYNVCEMKKTVREMLQYMSGTNREHDIIMPPSDYQYMLDCFYYFIDNGCRPENIKAVDCRLNIGVISYTLYVLYKLIYPKDLSKRKAWLEFICALFRKLPSPEELYNNFSRRSDEFLKYYFSGYTSELIDYIRNH